MISTINRKGIIKGLYDDGILTTFRKIKNKHADTILLGHREKFSRRQ